MRQLTKKEKSVINKKAYEISQQIYSLAVDEISERLADIDDIGDTANSVNQVGDDLIESVCTAMLGA